MSIIANSQNTNLSKISDGFINTFNDLPLKDGFISYGDVQELLGYTNKCTVINILNKKIYRFVNGVDFKIEKN
ncbi:MAG: hypothetical protein Barrevirus28_4 [Barrevirus sp.]|uniref:Uncharacterized protein n=1 Tax=Barrevirus sp. TaxID=2487763 RepID=A0A3G4ZQV7_9VIRU|nr:MAG: hypothetical protein Barrevirus28_4 [Barrevirus sp.]